MNRLLVYFLICLFALSNISNAAYIGSPPLLVANGGTGQTTLTNHGVLVGAGTNGITQLAVPASGTVLTGVASADPSFSATPTLGVAGTTLGTLSMTGNTSGTITIQPQAAAGTYNFNLPTGAGNSGQLLASAGGAGAAMTFDNIASHLTAGTNITITGTTNATINTTAVPPTVTTFTGSLPVTLGSTNLLTTISSMGTPAAGVYSLPAVATNLRSCLKDGTTNFNTNNATVKPTPTTLTIDGTAGSTGIVMNQKGQELCFISDGTNWFIE